MATQKKCDCDQVTYLVNIDGKECYDPKVHGSSAEAKGRCFNCQKLFDDPAAKKAAAKVEAVVQAKADLEVLQQEVAEAKEGLEVLQTALDASQEEKAVLGETLLASQEEAAKLKADLAASQKENTGLQKALKKAQK